MQAHELINELMKVPCGCEIILDKSKFKYDILENGTCRFRNPEYPKCNYYASKGTWSVSGGKIITGCGVGPLAFIQWYKDQSLFITPGHVPKIDQRMYKSLKEMIDVLKDYDPTGYEVMLMNNARGVVEDFEAENVDTS